MEDEAMQLSRRQKQALLTMVSDRPKFSEMSEGQQRYARAQARRILDEKAQKRRAGSLKPTGEPNNGQNHYSSGEEREPNG